MKLDDLREELRARDASAEQGVRVDAAKLRARGLRETGAAMGRLRAWLWVDVALNGVAVLWLGGFEAAHPEARFLAAAIPLHATALAHLVLGARQLAALRRLAYDGPIVALQRALERLRVGRIRATTWTLLLAPLLWVPLLVVALEALAGVDAYAALDRAWLAANVAFGVAFVPFARWGAKRLVDRAGGSPLVRRVLRDLAGRNLSAAQAFLDEAARFEAGAAPSGGAP